MSDAAPRTVVSRDGTEIAYWTRGTGEPLVLVHGTPADSTRWRPLLPHLEQHVTAHVLDRRGRGASGDGLSYGAAREFEDVAAVVDAVASDSASAVDVYGHSFGGFVAFGAAALTRNVRRLVLYEGWPLVDAAAFALPPRLAERLDTLVADGDRDGAVETLFRQAANVPDEELAALRADPSWAARVASVHTVTRELRGVADSPFDVAWAARIGAPTLLVAGAESDDPSKRDIDAVAAALSDARVVVLEGHGHLADILAPEVFAGHLLAFLRGSR